MRYILFLIFLLVSSTAHATEGTKIDLSTACTLRNGSYPYSIAFTLGGKEILSDKGFIITKDSIFFVHQGQTDRYFSFYECQKNEPKLIDRREISANMNINRVLHGKFILLKTTESEQLTIGYYDQEKKEIYEINSVKLMNQSEIKQYLRGFKLHARITSIREGEVRVEVSRIKRENGAIYRYGKKVFVIE